MNAPERWDILSAKIERVRAKRAQLRDMLELDPGLAHHVAARASSAREQAWSVFAKRWLVRCAEHPLATHPLVSLVIAAADDAWLVRALDALTTTWFTTLAVEIIVVTSSPGLAARVRASAPGCIVVERDDACDDALSAALPAIHGTYVCLLDERVIVTGGCLDRLASLLEEQPKVGLAAARVERAHGWNDDGSIATADGRFVAVEGDVAAASVRDADIAPEGAVLVRTEIVRAVGGLERRLLGSRYRLAQLCATVRAAGFRTVVHTGSRVREESLLDEDRVRFVQLNRAWLTARSLDPAEARVNAARRSRRGEVVLVVISRLPLLDWSEDERTHRLLRELRESGYYPMLLPEDFVAREPALSQARALGVEVLCGDSYDRGRDATLAAALPILDAVWFVGAGTLERNVTRVRKNRALYVIYAPDRKRDGDRQARAAAKVADLVACASAEDAARFGSETPHAEVVDGGGAPDALRRLRDRLRA
ncbi:MAG: hypothetical protein KGN02_01860 [bacterium]|nr:hypothetical protein [bacterium]